jgi:hypothetical protein
MNLCIFRVLFFQQWFSPPVLSRVMASGSMANHLFFLPFPRSQLARAPGSRGPCVA